MNVKSFFSFCLAAFLLSCASPLLAEEKQSVKAHLLTEEKSIQPGKKFWVAVELDLEKGWDIYWINPGDAGFPPKVDWKLPEGFTISELNWPYPEKFEASSMVGFGYTESVLLLAEVTPPQEVKGEKIQIAADVKWLACKEACVPGESHIEVELPVLKTAPLKEESASSKFEKARAHLPQVVSEGVFSQFIKEDEVVLNLKGDFGEIEEALFISEKQEVIDHHAPQVLQKGENNYQLNLKKSSTNEEALKGVLILSEKGSGEKKAFFVNDPQTVQKQGGLNIPVALILAFLGGLILNAMPCVLPVIALKIFSFVKLAQERRSEMVKQGLFFTAGVVLSFWALSALLLLLRASGESIGWGFQLQEPMFVAVMVIVLFVLGLSLFGLFELGTSLAALGQGKKYNSLWKGSLMSGALATLVATPCTGPFLGSALGFAMTLSPFAALTIFTSMALGMASPYLFFSIFPSFVRYLPKPGGWMILFKQLTGFVMMATTLWLIWVFAAQTDQIALFVLLGALLVIALASWMYGKWGLSFQKTKRTIALTCAALLFLVGGGSALYVTKEHRLQTIEHKQESQWLAFSPEKVDALRKEGKPVFIDFTAKWCLICQANKATLHSSEVEEAFMEKNVVRMEADWTMKDPTITERLRQLGRSGVPVYVLYPADPALPPYILPQTLSKRTVLDYLQKLDLEVVQNDR